MHQSISHPDWEGMCEYKGICWNTSETALKNTIGVGRRVWIDSRYNTEILPKTVHIVSPEFHEGGWIYTRREETVLESTAAIGSQPSQVDNIQQQSGCPSVKRTLYFARSVDLLVSKEIIRSVVKAYQLIDPAPVHWKKGKLGVENNWSRLAMDITHYDGKHFLTLIDYSPSRFAMWWPLH